MYVGFCQSVAWARFGCTFNATLQIECDPVVLRERRVLKDNRKNRYTHMYRIEYQVYKYVMLVKNIF
jgi:hypothetical protein